MEILKSIYTRAYFYIDGEVTEITGERKCTLNMYVENGIPKWGIIITGLIDMEGILKILTDKIKIGHDQYKVCIKDEKDDSKWGEGEVKIKISFIAGHKGDELSVFTINCEGLTDINNWTVGMDLK